ncbi:MAG TPA: hypothetical protein VN668_05685 [Stellaceae bacterium]|nr:hypothetical protein [Stellaceae bacterium]
MTPEGLLGWLVLLALLLGISATLVLPSLRLVERALRLGLLRWPLRLAMFGVVAAALWAVIPVAVQYLFPA